VVVVEAGQPRNRETGEVAVGGVEWSFGADIEEDSRTGDAPKLSYNIIYFNFDCCSENFEIRDLFWHLFPGEMQEYADGANQNADSSFRKIRKITTADFKTFCSLLLTGSLCRSSGCNLWRDDQVDFMRPVGFSSYMSLGRFEALKQISGHSYPPQMHN